MINFMPKPTPGQIWRERDNRFTRYVRVVRVKGAWAEIETVESSQEGWRLKPRSRKGLASVERFNGKRGGYVLPEGGAS